MAGYYILMERTVSAITYYDAWLLTRYCLDIKRMSYDELLADARSEEIVEAEMMKWYKLKSRVAH
jgi:hypothetical protein